RVVPLVDEPQYIVEGEWLHLQDLRAFQRRPLIARRAGAHDEAVGPVVWIGDDGIEPCRSLAPRGEVSNFIQAVPEQDALAGAKGSLDPALGELLRDISREAILLEIGF